MRRSQADGIGELMRRSKKIYSVRVIAKFATESILAGERTIADGTGG
jgi:hypothetical protein